MCQDSVRLRSFGGYRRGVKMGILVLSDSFTKSSVPFPVAHMRLPPFPQIALKVLQLTQEDTVSLSDLGDLISSDTAFASEILTIANSFTYATRFQVRGISEAVSVIGISALNGICITVGARSYLGRSLSKPVMHALWKDNMATALIAEMVAGAGQMNKSIAYTAGILHDVGRLALGVIQLKEYSNILLTHQGSPASMLACETRGIRPGSLRVGSEARLQLELAYRISGPDYEPSCADGSRSLLHRRGNKNQLSARRLHRISRLRRQCGCAVRRLAAQTSRA